MPLLIAGLLALSAAVIVLFPLLGLDREAVTQAAPAAQVADAAERERLARQALREVEFDYTLGNLETGDYEELRDRYEARALTALKSRYQREQELDAQIERQLDTLRQQVGATATMAQPAAQPHSARAATAERTRPAGASVRDRRAPKRKGA
jgi:hypothetical protein